MNPTPMTQRQAAYTATAKARAKGELVKPESCERCGNATSYVYAHHPDYSKPLEVRWLCGSCHKLTHIEAGEVRNRITGLPIRARSDQEKQEEADRRWQRVKKITIRSHLGWNWQIRPSPIGKNIPTKRGAIQLARSFADRYSVPVIEVYKVNGDLDRIIRAKKNGTKKGK